MLYSLQKKKGLLPVVDWPGRLKISVTSYYTNSLALSLEQILKVLLILVYLKNGQYLDPCILYLKLSLKDTAELAAVMNETPGRVCR